MRLPWRHVAERVAVPVLLTVLVAWALAAPLLPLRIPLPVPPPGGVWAIAAATVGVVALTRWFRRRMGIGERATHELPDPLYTMYLATVIIAGVPEAVLLAVLIPLLDLLPDIPLHRRSLDSALRRSTSAALTTLLGGLTYLLLSDGLGPQKAHLLSTDMWRHVFAALAAAGVMFVGIVVASALSQQERDDAPLRLSAALRRQAASPMLSFGLLLLSIGPLVPFAEYLDDPVSVFAWTLFVAPLCAYYYLALVSVRLQQRTDEVVTTTAQLGVAHRRQAELGGYARVVTRMQEDERRRVARELLDNMAQTLVALSRGLDALGRHDADRVDSSLTRDDTRLIAELSDVSRQTLEGIRRVCYDLRPSVLDDLGLCAALDSLAEATSRRGLPCTCCVVGDPYPCSPEVEVAVYRIAQEAVGNAWQHARASQAAVEIAFCPTELKLQVADDGRGFDYAGVYRRALNASTAEDGVSRGFGLLWMRERAAQIGAQFAVESMPGSGTSVTVRLPLAAPEVE